MPGLLYRSVKYAHSVQKNRRQAVPGGLAIGVLTRNLRSSILPNGMIAIVLATVLAAIAACSSNSSQPPEKASLRPCPRYNNHMPGSLQTPCREVDGKYYRTD